MDIPTTYLSLHDVTGLRAAALASLDTPLILTFDTKYGPMQISIYLNPNDPAKVELLADAINAAMKEPATPKVACPIEEAAYKAHDDYWSRLRADLDRCPIEAETRR